MRFFNIIGAFGVLTCNIIVSYNHSIELFQSGGFHGWMAHVAVIGAETTFILGALNIVVARLRGVSPGAPAVLGGLLGVALVSWSNAAAGWSHGLPGILLGLATPASLIVAEAMLSREILQRRAAMERAERERAERRTEERAEERKPEESAKVSTPATAPAEVSAPVVEEKHLQAEREEKREKEAEENRGMERERKAANPSISSTPSTPTAVSTSSNVSAVSTVSTPAVEEREQAKQKRSLESKGVSNSSAARKALEIYEQEGKLPGRRRLMGEAGVSEWEARKTLQELRQKVAS